eukprot:TRINITY_DN2541_c0_g1_i2.p1 TRINITY_DN2541_c0_g1~~TRINITY_DN2541_c0_g1_i2.p1  ORF type:complete len:498 (+),score=95.34 TRINITY_DN2541_c0_g1_i2:316-1809(+)
MHFSLICFVITFLIVDLACAQKPEYSIYRHNEYFKVEREIDDHKFDLTGFSLSKNGDYMVTGSRDHTVNVYYKNEKIQTLTLHDEVLTVSLDPSATWLIVGGTRFLLEIYRFNSEEKLFKSYQSYSLIDHKKYKKDERYLEMFYEHVWNVEFNPVLPDVFAVASGGWESGNIAVFHFLDGKNWTHIFSSNLFSKWCVRSRWTDNGRVLMAASSDQSFLSFRLRIPLSSSFSLRKPLFEDYEYHLAKDEQWFLPWQIRNDRGDFVESGVRFFADKLLDPIHDVLERRDIYRFVLFERFTNNQGNTPWYKTHNWVTDFAIDPWNTTAPYGSEEQGENNMLMASTAYEGALRFHWYHPIHLSMAPYQHLVDPLDITAATSVDYSPDGKYLIVCTFKGQVKVLKRNNVEKKTKNLFHFGIEEWMLFERIWGLDGGNKHSQAFLIRFHPTDSSRFYLALQNKLFVFKLTDCAKDNLHTDSRFLPLQAVSFDKGVHYHAYRVW